MENEKTFQELTFKDNFMFGAVMADENICRELLELILAFPIEKVTVSREKSIVYHSAHRGVRLDVFAKDDNNTFYNVEMQVEPPPGLARRSRYYHSQIDMELLVKGQRYTELPTTYVIFICDFDPFGLQKYCYHFENRCTEDTMLPLKEGSRTIFLNTHGTNDTEVSGKLVSFLQFVKADSNESAVESGNEFVHHIQETIKQIQKDRDMEERYMLLQEVLKDERDKGLEQGLMQGTTQALLEILTKLGEIPESLQLQISNVKSSERLSQYLKLAINADSIEQFIQSIKP